MQTQPEQNGNQEKNIGYFHNKPFKVNGINKSSFERGEAFILPPTAELIRIV